MKFSETLSKTISRITCFPMTPRCLTTVARVHWLPFLFWPASGFACFVAKYYVKVKWCDTSTVHISSVPLVHPCSLQRNCSDSKYKAHVTSYNDKDCLQNEFASTCYSDYVWLTILGLKYSCLLYSDVTTFENNCDIKYVTQRKVIYLHFTLQLNFIREM